jgi:hypothetical protein
MSKKKQKAVITGKCRFCEKPLTDMHFCHGCKAHICDDCDTNIDRGWGAHIPEDHRLDEDEL